MDLKKFTAGNWERRDGIKVFVPQTVHHSYTWKSTGLNVLLEKSALALGQLNGISTMPGTGDFYNMFLLYQAAQACGVEIMTAALPQSHVAEADRACWEGVHRYVAALRFHYSQKGGNISNRQLNLVYRHLTETGAPEHTAENAFRKQQLSHDGKRQTGAPPEAIPALMDDLLGLLNDPEIETPVMLRAAIAHYQLLQTSPYDTANHRMAHLIPNLSLLQAGMLDEPYLCLAGYFNREREAYLHSLQQVREKDKLTGWLRFFLTAMQEASATACKRIKSLHQLKAEKARMAQNMGKKAGTALKLLDHLYTQPVLAAQDITMVTEVSKVSAYKLIEDFMDKGILKETRGARRNRLFAFSDYLRLFGQE